MIAFFRNQRAAEVWPALGIFCAGVFLFTFGLCHQEIISFESRFYLFALEMWRHGVSWFPTLNGTPYPDYPVTATLIIYGLAKIVGHLDKWVAVLPTASAAAGTLTVTYLIGALHAKRWGWLAVCFLLLTLTFVGEARTISPDQYITLITALTFYVAHSADVLKRDKRLYFLPVLLLLGFAFRGPIGLVIPAAVLGVYYFAARNWRALFYVAVIGFLLLVLACILLGAIASHVGGMRLVCDVVHTQVFGRMSFHNVPWYFYFNESVGAYALPFPLVLLMLCGLVFELPKSRQKDKVFLLQLCGWVLVILLGMTIPAIKKIRYILAFSPALALLSAYLFSVPQKQKYLHALRALTYWVIYFIPLECLIATIVLEVFTLLHRINPHIIFTAVVVLFLVLQWLSWLVRRDIGKVFAVAALTAMLFNILLVEPVNLMLNRTHHLVMQVEILRTHEHANLVFYQENPDGLPIKYLVNLPHEVKPIFISTPNELDNYSTPAIFITDRDYFAHIPLDILHKTAIIYTGNLGHDEVVVFKKLS